MNDTLLVIGRTGQLARALAEAAAADGRRIELVGRPDLDLADPDLTRAQIVRRKPGIIINTAAYTAVDQAETEPDQAYAINRDGARAVAEGAAEAGARLVHLSTDYVFSGYAATPYREDAAPSPVNVYGASKLAGERAVLGACPDAAIVRSSGIFSASGGNFVTAMVGLARTHDSVRVVNDQIQGPTPADSLAGVLLRLAGTDGRGVFHASGTPPVSWAQFAEAIFALLQAQGWPVPEVVRISAQSYGAPAPRPRYSVLADTRLEAELGPWARDWRAGLERVIRALSTSTGTHPA